MDYRFFPRAIGNPHQKIIRSASDFNEFIAANNGLAPVFTSHNAFASFSTTNQPTSVHLRNVVLDLDSVHKPENALLDAMRFSNWASSLSLPHSVTFSGRKGFHCYLYLKPEVYSTGSSLSKALHTLQSHIIHECKMRTADPHVLGDARRLMRVPGTQWASFNGRSNETNGRYCYTVPRDLLLSGDIHEILTRSTEPPPPTIPPPSTSWTLRSFLTHHKIKPRTDYSTTSPSFANYHEPSDALLKALLPRPCIHSGLMDSNPPHEIRFEAAATLAFAGHPESWIQSFFDDIAKRAGWVDRHNGERRHYQVHHIVNHKPAYKPFTCGRLKQAGVCIGQTCPRFFE